MTNALPHDADELAELIELCAVDSELFCHTFFPRTVRQASPPFHARIWNRMDSQSRLVNLQVFRDGAKTSLCRMYTAKRIAYGISHTILYIGKSEGHATRSGRWLRNNIENNIAFKSVFKLSQGKKWQDSEFEIWHGTDEYPISVLCLGITGSIRGINLDDFRPDLIVIDDVIDEENSATREQRDKIEDLILGALKDSLAPATEAPDAKMVMLQTPLNKEDASCKALADTEWVSEVFGCWTDESKGRPLSQQVSAWQERYPSETLRKEKKAAIARNKLSLWLREKECTLISPETASFKEDWLRFYTIVPEAITVVIVIDPVPPPTDLQIAKGLKGKDYESFAVVGRSQKDFFLLEYSLNRGHTPEWTIAEFFRLCVKWHPRCVVVETVMYQKTLSWLLKQAMDQRGQYFVIKEYKDRRKKYDRIVDGLSGPASNLRLFIQKDHFEFISQFRSYPSVSHDDLIESVAIGVAELSGLNYTPADDAWDDPVLDESDIPSLSYVGGAP